MYKRYSKHKQATSPESFAMLIRQNIPSFVIERLRPMKEDLRNGMKGLSENKRKELREALRMLGKDLYEELNTWADQFLTCLESSNALDISDKIKQLSKPPKEPLGIWEELSDKTKDKGTIGVAACLMLYNLGCARAVKQFKNKNRI